MKLLNTQEQKKLLNPRTQDRAGDHSTSTDRRDGRVREGGSTRGPSWGHSRCVLGAIGSFLEPFCGHLSPKNDKVSENMTLRHPHEGPCVDADHALLHPRTPREDYSATMTQRAVKLDLLCGGTSSIRKRTPLGPYRGPMPRVLAGS